MTNILQKLKNKQQFDFIPQDGITKETMLVQRNFSSKPRGKSDKHIRFLRMALNKKTL